MLAAPESSETSNDRPDSGQEDSGMAGKEDQQEKDLELNEETVEDLEADEQEAKDVKGGMMAQATWSKAYTGWCC